MTILLTIYIVAYYIITFNMFFEGIDGQTLKTNTFIKQILFNVMLITVFVSGITIFNMQNMVIGPFLTLGDKLKTAIIGSGAVDGIKLWGYRIFSIIIILSVYMGIRAFKKNNTSKVLKSLVVVPIYLVGLFVVIIGYNIFFIKPNELDKQKSYITSNIDFTKTAYNVNINEETITNAGTITENDANNNEKVINNIPIVTEDIAINNLLQTQTSTGYYTYDKAKATLYNDELVYIAARELDNSHEADEYTHGYGAVITAASETDEAGNIKYVSREFENSKIKEPRIYYGIENSRVKIVRNGVNEFDYPTNSTSNKTYTYDGEGGVSLNFLDKICVGIKQGRLGVITSNGNSKILLNTNIIERAKRIVPYLMYDENPYLIIADDGKLYWVLDAYTVSNEYPYSQKTKMVYKNETTEINYIRNSVKVIVNAFTGETDFYITDKTDPVAMVYNNMYKTVFKEAGEIPSGISKYFTYSEFLYNVQAEVLNLYHNVSADVLYRGNDVWEIASYSSLITKSATTVMKPYYTMVKTVDSDKSELGLVTLYNQSGKESLNAYLVGTVADGKNELTLYKFSADNTVLGPIQLDSLTQQDEIISSEISSLNATGTKLTKEMIVIPIDDKLLYVMPIYQTSLNETNSVPVLKKVVVASGNKVAIGDNLTKAIKNLLSPNNAVSIEVEDTSSIEGLLESIVKANNNLTESNDSNDWSQIGRDIEALQLLINQLEQTMKNEKANNNVSNQINENLNNNIMANDT